MNVIELAEREVRRDADDLARLKRRYPGCDFVALNDHGDSAVTSIRDAVVGRNENSDLENKVLEVIDSVPESEWTSRLIINQLRVFRYPLSDNDGTALNVIGAALANLLQAGKIDRTHEGRGRDPHRYMSKPKSEEEETPAEAGA